MPTVPVYTELWRVLEIQRPDLNECARQCRLIAQKEYSTAVDAVLMDLYRYMDRLLEKVERSKNRLATLPLACSGQWITRRPVYLVEDRELRGQLAKMLPTCDFWAPPCEVRDLPHLAEALGVQLIEPILALTADRRGAQEEGENTKGNASCRPQSNIYRPVWPGTSQEGEKIASGIWDESQESAALRISIALPRSMHCTPHSVQSRYTSPCEHCSHVTPLRFTRGLRVSNYAKAEAAPLHPSSPMPCSEGLRPNGSRPWLESKEQPIEMTRLASDEEKRQNQLAAAKELADRIQTSAKGKIAVTPPVSTSSVQTPRRLKSFEGSISGVVVQSGAVGSTAASGC